MSNNLNEHSYFIKLLLETSKQQARALLETVTNKQVIVISEICLNLLTIPLDKETASIINRRKQILKKLSNSKLTVKIKRRLIATHYRQISHTLLHIKNQLLDLLA